MRTKTKSPQSALSRSDYRLEGQQITKLHNEIIDCARTTKEKAIEAGGLLYEVKNELPHGEWLPWLKAHVPFSDQTARNYIVAYEHRDDPKFKTVLNLTDGYRLSYGPEEIETAMAADKRIKKNGQSVKRFKSLWRKSDPTQQFRLLHCLFTNPAMSRLGTMSKEHRDQLREEGEKWLRSISEESQRELETAVAA